MPVPLVRLFSLDLLKTFVAVGRRRSITQAADDLCLTQSAVSRQVRSFEEQVGTRLFVRRQHGVEFTPEGERLFRTADYLMQQLQDLAEEVRQQDAPQAVTVTASIGVTGLWLLPRLNRLQQMHPKLDVRLSASNQLSDLRAEGIDLAIRYCREAAAPDGAVRLFDETIDVVAHPSLLAGRRWPDEVLASCPLLEFDDPRPWLQWRPRLDPREWKLAQQRGVLRFNQYDQVIHAALAGQGLALGRLELIQPLLDSGQLTPVPVPVKDLPCPNSYWLVQATERPREAVLQVAQWIRNEAAGLQRAMAARKRGAHYG